MKDEAAQGYEYNWAPDSRNWSQECECGNLKTRGMEACTKCAFLDGSHEGQALVIDTLRGHADGLTTNELVEELHGKVTKSAYQGVTHILKALLKRGRVSRREEENEVEHNGHLMGNTKRVVYYLKGQK